jgi:hypothetical protein
MPIPCNDDQVALTQQLFPCSVTDFLIKYLGITLSIGKLPKAAFQPIIDKMADKLPVWRGRSMHRSGRLTLIKTTLAAIPVYLAISHAFPRVGVKNVYKDFQSLSTVGIGFSSWWQMSHGVGQSAAPARAQQIGHPRSQANGTRLTTALALVYPH